MKSSVITLVMAVALVLSAVGRTSVYGQVKQSHGITAVADTGMIEAYSDTTAVDTAAGNGVASPSSYSSGHSVSISLGDVSDPFDLIAYLVTVGAGGVIVAVFFVILGLLFLLSPLILIGLIFYFVFRRRKERYKIVEKAMETGRPVPEEFVGNDKADRDILWRRGIKNASIGLGIVALALVISADFLAGVGLLFAFYGAGQAVIIARTSGKNSRGGDGGEQRDSGEN